MTRLLLNDRESMAMMESISVQQDVNNAPAMDLKAKVINLFCQNLFSVEAVSVEEQVYAVVKFLMVAEKLQNRKRISARSKRFIIHW